MSRVCKEHFFSSPSFYIIQAIDITTYVLNRAILVLQVFSEFKISLKTIFELVLEKVALATQLDLVAS